MFHVPKVTMYTPKTKNEFSNHTFIDCRGSDVWVSVPIVVCIESVSHFTWVLVSTCIYLSLYIYIYVFVFFCHTNKAINYGAGHRVSPYSRKNGSENDATNMKSGASQGNALWMLSPMMQLSIYIIKLHTNPHPEKNKNYEISLRGPGASENPVPLCMGL